MLDAIGVAMAQRLKDWLKYWRFQVLIPLAAISIPTLFCAIFSSLYIENIRSYTVILWVLTALCYRCYPHGSLHPCLLQVAPLLKVTLCLTSLPTSSPPPVQGEYCCRHCRIHFRQTKKLLCSSCWNCQ